MSNQTYRVSVEILAEKAKAGISQLKAAFVELEKGAGNASKKLDSTGAAAAKSQKIFGNTTSFDKTKTGFKQASDAADNYGKKTQEAGDKHRKLMGALAAAGTMATTALAAVGGVAGIISNVSQAQREFDVLNAQLITATGSAEKAGQVFGELQKFAKETPYGLAQATEGYAKLKNLGLDPSIDSLRSFGNTASAMGKDLNQMIEAVADASTGEFERLKEFGIKAKKQGSDVEFTFQGVTTKVKNSSQQIQKYLLDIGNVNFAGAMEARMNSLDGSVAGFEDAMQNFWLTLSKSGVGDVLKDVVNDVTAVIENLTEKLNDPAVADGMRTAIESVKGAFESVGAAIDVATSAFESVYDWIVKNQEVLISLGLALGVVGAYFALPTIAALALKGALVAVTTVVGVATSVMGAFGAVMAFVTSPIGLTVVAIASLVAASVYLYRNWDTVKAKAQEVWNSVKETVSNAWESIKSSTLAKWEEIKQTASTKFEEVKNQIKEKFESIKQVFLSSPLGQIFATHFSVISTVAKSVFSAVQTVVRTAFGIIKGIVTGDVTAVKNAFSKGFNELKTIAKGAVDKVWGELKSLGGKLLQAGRDAVQGFINGFTEKMNAAYEKAREMASKVVSVVKSALDIHSPSRVMKALGGYAGEGFVLGLGEKVKDAKQVAQDLANAVTSTIQDLHKNLFMLQNTANPLAELDYKMQFGELAELTDKQKARIKELAQANLDLARSNDALTSFTNSMADLDRQLALLGVTDPIKQLEYDLANGGIAASYTTEQLDRLKSKMLELEQAKALQGFNSELEKATSQMQKQEYLLKNIGDKYAGMKFDLAQKGYNSEQISQMVDVQNRTDILGNFAKWQSGSQEASPIAKLQAEHDEKMQQLAEFHAQGLLLEEQYLEEKYRQEELFAQKSTDLQLSKYESNLAMVGGLMKDILGQSSQGYKAIFAMEKGYALARIFLANKEALAKAWASAPFPQNLPAVAKTAMDTGAIASAVSAIRPVIGQAHDGIMSVPKSGTWNLEKGERVLPRHTAQNLDNTLNRLQGRGETKVIINNYTSEKAEVQKNENGDIMVVIGKVIDAKINQRFMNARRQGGELYGR